MTKPPAGESGARRVSEGFAVEINGRPIGKVNKAFQAAEGNAGPAPDVIPKTLRHVVATWGLQPGGNVNSLAGALE